MITPPTKVLKCGPSKCIGSKWFVPTSVGNYNVDLLLDTGSDITLLPWECYKQCHNRHDLKQSNKSILAANNIELKVFGTCFMPLKIGNFEIWSKITIIPPGSTIPPILGADVLNQLTNLKIEYASGYLCFEKFKIKLLRKSSTEGCAYLFTPKEVTIPPRSEAEIHVRYKEPVYGKLPRKSCIEPLNHVLADKNLI